MKKIVTLLCVFLICSAFQCEDEPLEGEFITSEAAACEIATIDTTEVALALLGADNDTYTEVCNAYKDALEAQILACGDEDGELQALIDNLGDCSILQSTNICEGSLDDNYFPLAVGNYWKWEFPFSIGPSQPDIIAEIVGIFEYNGNEYFEFEYTGSNGQYHFKYLRYDSDNNLKVLVYFLDITGNYYEEHTVIPNISLSVGDQWDFYSAFDSNTFINPIQEVQGIGAYETEDCSYEDVLEIFTKDTEADPQFPQLGILDYKIYKKGIGIINFDGNILTEIILN